MSDLAVTAEKLTQFPTLDGALPPENVEHARLLPADKVLPADWLDRLSGDTDSLRLRGEELRYVGMPVSGICTGQVYLSGDGRLCHWDVFKAYGGRKDTGDPHGPHYADPQVPDQPFLVGMAFRTSDGELRTLDAQGFKNVDFEGSYPIGKVRFNDPDCTVGVDLEAFSPFVPLDSDDSGLPATVLTYRFTNLSTEIQELTVGAWMENAVFPFETKPAGRRKNEIHTSRDSVVLHCTAELEDPSVVVDGWGSMSLALLHPGGAGHAKLDLQNPSDFSEQKLDLASEVSGQASADLNERILGGLSKKIMLPIGGFAELNFVVSWHFPRYSGGKVFFSTMETIPKLSSKQRYYATKFSDSLEVARYVERHFERLTAATKLWVSTWYDSSLPRWFMDRTFINTSILATQTAHRFEDGRFYGWEGVDSCPGTCQHVWQYAQAVAAVFPDLERLTREHVDYGIAYHSDGSMDYRAEASSHGDQAVAPAESVGEAIMAVDGTAGTIIRVLREHKHSPDIQFLRRLWPRVRKSLEFLMKFDRDGDGLLEGPQYNTLDATWYGKIPWISSLYLAALAAGKQMAIDIDDQEFASRCESLLAVGRESFVEQLFNGRYFEHVGDATKPRAVDLQEGCYIDQVLGQSFAHQVGFERVISQKHSVSALTALWRYNFAVDVGPYRNAFTGVSGGRWYAMPGEAGMLMCTWPQAAYDPSGRIQADIGLGITSEGYLNECMTGFEYQVAAHMLAEGMVYEGLSLTRAIHDRYAPSLRNPWNEIECGDHYSRAMASYGVYITACGFDYHGPRQSLTMDPKIGEENFKAPVLFSEGWGNYSQKHVNHGIEAELSLKFGSVKLRTLKVRLPEGIKAESVELNVADLVHDCKFSETEEGMVEVCLGSTVMLDASGTPGMKLRVTGLAS
ncbi:GH116 family glycosyl hydrolase [Roseateles sp.]|uniref:GH116 family glycosyl hydrolase n=1 Tax=Roseateles sp. TaxID=1971397 RepID=UPI003D1412DC